MFQRVIIFLAYILTLIGMFLLGRVAESLSILVIPAAAFFLMLFVFPKHKTLMFPAIGALLIYIIVKIVMSDMDTRWFLIQGFVTVLPAGGFYFISSFWAKDLIYMRQRTEQVRKITEEIRTSEHESLREQERLEREVNEIVSLFELAREFNECIDLKEIVQVLSKQVFTKIPFERGKLVFLDEDILEGDQEQIAAVWEQHHASADAAKLQEFVLEREVVSLLAKKQTVSRFDTPAQDADRLLEKHPIRFPFWVFPLVVGGEVTAAFWVEGARAEDFDKFEIIASQLALHVKKVKLYNKVRELSIVDGLTQLFVRRHFLERFRDELIRSIKYKLSLVVVMLDIDHFKQYNDTYGHLVGDVALRQVAQTVKEVIRRVDIAGRYGGEEFVIVLPETDQQGGLDAAERIRSKIAKKIFRAYDEDTKLTVSVGLTVFPDRIAHVVDEAAVDDALSVLLRQADESLYRAKEEGRNHIVMYNP